MELHVAQSTVTSHIKSLETELDLRLFDPRRSTPHRIRSQHLLVKGLRSKIETCDASGVDIHANHLTVSPEMVVDGQFPEWRGLPSGQGGR